MRPDVAPAPPAGPGARWVFLLDTSASAAEGMDHRLAALRGVLAALPGRRVELVAFDQEVRPAGHLYPARGGARAWRRSSASRGLLGGTDLHGALADIHGARRAASPAPASCW